ncbi:MAG: glycosyltransferase family 2 protein [Patescibacteria group bacterium]
MSNEVDLSIVIVTWNSEKDISDCLTSIEKAKQNLNIEVFVVDNNSKDNTTKVITDSYTDINLIRNTANKGFAKANNQAIKISRGGYVLLLNPDTKVNENTLIDSIAYMRNYEKAGILGCAIHNPDGTMQYSVRKFPSLLSQILVLCKLHNFFPNLKPIKKYFALDFDYTKEQKVDQVMGAYMFLRRSCIEQIGMLDEHFWIWFEDVDYCRRAKSAGWEVIYSPTFSIIHNQSQSFARLCAVKEQKLFNKSLLYYMKKHHGRFVYWILMMFIPISIALSAIVGVFEQKNNKINIQ